MKLTKINMVLVLVIIVLSTSLVIAQNHVPIVPPEDFILFTPENQASYVSDMQDFSGGNYEIAYDYFSNSLNIMSAPDAFERFMYSLGITISIDSTAPSSVFNYNSIGTLVGAGGEEVNIYDFSNTEESLQIDGDGNIVIIDRDKREWPFSGTLGFSQGKFTLDDGEFAGQMIQNGKFILGNGKMKGIMESFGGLHFDEDTSFEFVKDTNTIKLVKANVVGVDFDTDIMIYGNSVSLPDGDMLHKGRLTFEKGRPVLVGSGSEVTVKGFTHKTKKGKTVQLLYAESAELDEIDFNEQEALAKIPQADEFEQEWKDQFSIVSELKSRQKELETELRKLTKQSGTTERIAEITEELKQIVPQITTESTKLRTITESYVPTIISSEGVHLRYKEQREKEYISVIPGMIPDGNYFIYGDEHIWLGGDGFSSNAEDGNPIFPEFTLSYEGWITRERKSQLEFEPKGGTIDAVKMSPQRRPLALEVTMSGEGVVTNGKYLFRADGEDVLISPADTFASEELVSSDMRFNYKADLGETKIYDLNVDGEYHLELTSEEREGLLQERASVMVFLDDYKEELKSKPAIRRIIRKLEPLEKDLNNLQGELEKALQLWRRAEQHGTDAEKKSTFRDVEQFESQIKKVDEQIKSLEQMPEYSEFKPKRDDLEFKQNDLDDINHRLVGNIGEHKSGIWGQIVSSEDGDSFVSYQERVEGFPVIKNTDIFQWTDEVLRLRAGQTVRGEELDIPDIFISNTDRLQLDFINGDQQCIDVQFAMAYQHALETGQDICYGSKPKCLSDYTEQPQIFVEDWMHDLNTRSYELATKRIERGKGGVWDDQIDILSVDEYDDIQPGDVLLYNGHAIGVKEVLEIPPGSGTKYIRQFAGSMPAIDAHIYQTSSEHGGLKSIEQLKSERIGFKDKKELVSIFRWKFRKPNDVVAVAK